MLPGETSPDDEAKAVVSHPDVPHRTHLIDVESLPEPDEAPEVKLDSADDYAEGVDAIPGTFKALLPESAPKPEDDA